MNDLGSVSVMSISISDYIYMRQEYSAAWSRVGSMEGAVGCAQAGIVRSSSGSGPRYEEEFELRQRKWCLGIEAMKEWLVEKGRPTPAIGEWDAWEGRAVTPVKQESNEFQASGRRSLRP